MSKCNVYIFCQPIRSGKTTQLLKWVSDKKNVAGILTPDKNGVRQLYNVETKQSLPLQLSENEDGIKIGRFVMDKKVIEIGKNWLLEHLEKNPEWLIIDEIGPLEILQSDGWEPAFINVLNIVVSNESSTKLLLVVRDKMLQSFLEKYNLHDAQILNSSYFQAVELSPLNGLVLCGGESKRMHQPKALLQYHDKPQYKYASQQLQPFCSQVFLSLHPQRSLKLEPDHLIIFDKKTYEDSGPISGLLSAYESYPNNSWLLLGCDYPYLTLSELLLLFNNRSKDIDAVCFENTEGYSEPLIAIYEAPAMTALKIYYNSGGRSLRKFTTLIKTKKLRTPYSTTLQSCDSIKDYLNFKN